MIPSIRPTDLPRGTAPAMMAGAGGGHDFARALGAAEARPPRGEPPKVEAVPPADTARQPDAPKKPAEAASGDPSRQGADAEPGTRSAPVAPAPPDQAKATARSPGAAKDTAETAPAPEPAAMEEAAASLATLMAPAAPTAARPAKAAPTQAEGEPPAEAEAEAAKASADACAVPVAGLPQQPRPPINTAVAGEPQAGDAATGEAAQPGSLQGEPPPRRDADTATDRDAKGDHRAPQDRGQERAEGRAEPVAAPLAAASHAPAMPHTEPTAAGFGQAMAQATGGAAPPAAPSAAPVTPTPPVAPQHGLAQLPSGPAQQVTPIIIAEAAKGAAPSRLIVALRPQELGAVQVSVEQITGGPAQVQILAERPETLALLHRDRAALEQALQAAGLSLSSEGVSLRLAEPGQFEGGAARHGAAGSAAGGEGRSDAQGQQDRNPAPRSPWATTSQRGEAESRLAAAMAQGRVRAPGLLDLAL